MHELRLRVDIGDGSATDRVDRQTRALYQDLRRLGVLSVRRATAEAPTGSMAGVGHDLAVLVLSGAFSAAALKAVSNVVVAYVNRTKARAVEWEFDGSKGAFTALSAKDQHTLVDAVAARVAAAEPAPSTTDEAGDTDGGAPDRTAGSD
ncbi:hypothetical protein ACFW9D_32080 [Streptomyces sp. NPDC059524]|uniref:hypothetical protein n=1 Tax=Streptomyces sp. NPDC059524 TaxID=3346856 RepID=UPI0036A4B537